MKFQFTDEQLKFREEIRQFVEKELPPDWDGVAGPTMAEMELDKDEVWEAHKTMSRKLGEKGWLAQGWPKEYGGQAKSHIEHAIFFEDMAYYRAPGINVIGILMIAPTIIVCGTDEQKAKHLKPMAKGESFWCEGFSEPEAGSDLASVRTRAVEKDDAFYLDGQKVWTSIAQRSGWCGLLARTDPDAPKHKGISFFLVDMTTPGVTVNPLYDMADGYDLNEVFFDNVRVPKENLLGKKNDGWNVAMTLLSFERSGSGFIGAGRRLLDDVVGYAREVMQGKQLTVQDHLIRHRIVELGTRIEISRLLAYRVAWMQDQGLIPEAESAMVKVTITEAMQELVNVGMQLLGLYGPLTRGSERVRVKGFMEHIYRCTLAPKIAAGTSEVQRNVIALRGLGLPR